MMVCQNFSKGYLKVLLDSLILPLESRIYEHTYVLEGSYLTLQKRSWQ